MLPLAPVRILLLGLISWTILGIGVYAAYEAYRALTAGPVLIHPLPAIDPPKDPTTEPTVAPNLELAIDPAIDVPERPSARISRARPWPWGFLALAAICLAFTCGGRWLVSLPFRQANAQAAAKHPAEPKLSRTFELALPCGSRLHGRVYGTEHLPTLILTHGWSLDSAEWKYLLPVLCARHRVVVWDLAGLGQSQGPHKPDYSLEKMSHDLWSVVNETCPHGPVVLVGHSIGGMIQQTFCRTHADSMPSIVKAMVLVHTTYTNPLNTNLAAGLTKPLQPFIALLNQSMIPLAPLYWLWNWQSYWNGTLHIAARLESFTGKQSWEQLDFSAWKGAVASPAVVARGNQGMLRFDEQATLPTIAVPVLVVSGQHDRLTVPAASAHIVDLLQRQQRRENAGGHLGHLEYAQQVSGWISEFTHGNLTSAG